MINSIPLVVLTPEHFRPPGQASKAGTEGPESSSSSSGAEARAGEAVELTCSICLCDLAVGDEARFLPCKHWYHKQV